MNTREYNKWKAEISDQYAKDMGILDAAGKLLVRQTDREILVEIRDALILLTREMEGHLDGLSNT